VNNWRGRSTIGGGLLKARRRSLSLSLSLALSLVLGEVAAPAFVVDMATLPQIVSRMCEGYSRNEIASETADFAELGSDRCVSFAPSWSG
jgi:hypothetical protein